VSSISEKLKVLESIVKTPLYGVVGYTHARLIYSTNVEGVTSLWSFNLKNKESKNMRRYIWSG